MNAKKKLLLTISHELGKSIKGETQSAIDYFRQFAEETRGTYGEKIPTKA